MTYARKCFGSTLVGLGLLVGAGGTPLAQGQSPATRAVLGEARAASAVTNPATTGAGTTVNTNALEQKLAKAKSELTVTLDAAGGTNQAAGNFLEDVSVRRALLERIVRLYEQQLSFNADLEAARNRRAELAREAQSWREFSEPRPYSILLVDSLHGDIQLEQEEVASAENSLASLAKLADEHRTALKRAEEKIRQFNEEMEEGRDAKAGSDLARRREMERLRSQNAAVTVSVLDQERQLWQERLSASRIRLGLLQRQLVLASAGAAFTEADVKKLTARLDGEQLQLEGELAEAETGRLTAAQALETARQELVRTQTPPGANPALAARGAEQVEVRRAQLETADAAVDALRFMLQAGTVERAIWEVRFASYRSNNAEILRQTKRQLEQFSRRVALWKNYYLRQGNHAGHQVALLESRLADLADSPDIASLVRERRAAWRECDQLLLRVVRRIERGERLVQRLSDGLREATVNLPAAGRVRNAFSDSRSFVSQVWNLELFVAQDTITVDGQAITGTRSITLGKIISAILILAVGYWLTGLVSRFMEPIFVRRFKIEANQARLIRRWVRVVLVFSLALFSLVSVKIPLTVFAFAGGALAIGLGFGLQTLLKNFVSGIIILFERPFRVGDVLDIAGQSGTVASIGIRSSVLQLWDGTETLIPNSTLLENNLTNWTYSSRAVRFTVKVGVSYGSDTRRVMQLLGEIAERHGLIEREPKPQVLFTNFGDNTLEFELRFWVDVVKANSAQIASDLRQMIAGTFGENGITIAFPQRDLHLNTARPLEVRVMATASQPLQDGAGKQAQASTGDVSGTESKTNPQHSANEPKSGPNSV